MTTDPATLSTVTFAVRRPGCAARADGLSLADALAERVAANRLAPGHMIVVDDAGGLTDAAVAALRADAAAHGDGDAVSVCDAALAGDDDARDRVAGMYLDAWAASV